MHFDRVHGWQEAQVTDATGNPTILAARAGYQIIVRRIRGTFDSGTFQLRSGASTLIGPVIEPGVNFDYPGLEIRGNTGEALTCVATDASVNIAIQYAYVKMQEVLQPQHS